MFPVLTLFALYSQRGYKCCHKIGRQGISFSCLGSRRLIDANWLLSDSQVCEEVSKDLTIDDSIMETSYN